MKTGKIVKENQPRPLPSSGNKTSAHKRWQLQEHAGNAALYCKGGSKENLKRQDEAKSCANSRRKLEFKELPLAGKKIYLDLKGVRQEKKVEEKLEKLGAIIEKFLSKEIHYFVTNQDKEKVKNDDQSSGSPNMSISSPFNSGHTPSPSTFEKKTFTVTRGRAMLQCAKMDSAADNIVERAKKLGVKIVPYLSLMKWLIKEQSRNYERVKEAPPSAKKAKVEDSQKSRKLLCKARNLKQPFIKFEAVNKFFRPVQVELNSWPYLNMNSPQGSCPFDDWLLGVNAVGSSKQEAIKRKNRQDVVGCWSAESEGQVDVPSRLQKMKKKGVPNQPVQQIPKNAQGRRLVNWERRKLAEKKFRQGFCECCEIRFDDVKKHLNSVEHSTFVKNEGNYRHLDSLITNGYNVQQFVSKVSNHPKLYSENSSNSLEYSSPGRIVLLTLSSSTSTHINPPKVAADAVLTIPDVKPACQTATSESDSVTSENNAPSVSESQNKTLTAKSINEKTLSKDTPLLTLCMKTPVKASSKMQTLLRDASPSLNGRRSPLKCLLNSPSRLDFNTTEKQATKPKGSSAAFPAAAMLVASQSLFPPETQQHSKNFELGVAGNQNENVEPVKSTKYTPPSSQENISAEQNQNPKNQWKLLGVRTQKICGGATSALPLAPSVTACFTPSQPLLGNTGKNLLSPLLGNSSGSKCASLSLKRNFRCSSGKTKSQRLFKLGEKWQVLSQQSVKKILFSDESPESFTGFDPQDIFKNHDNSDVSYETVSEVILTDPSEFEWVLGNCEGKRLTEGTHSDPSSQATFYNSPKSLPLRDPTITDCTTTQEKSVAQENDFKKYVDSQEDNVLVPFCGEEDKCLRECTELNSADGGNCIRDSANSESPKNYSDNVEVYLNSHKDFPPYIPNGQTSGYCSPSFQQNSHIEPTLIEDNQHYSTNDFETKVIQDLDYSQTPRYLHLEAVSPPASNCESGFDNRPVKHIYLSNNQHFQQFQYLDSNYPTNLDARSQNTLHNYPQLFDEATMEQSCSQTLNPSPSLQKSQERITPGHYSLSDTSMSNYRENTPIIGDGGQSKKAILPQTPLPNLSYECSSLSVMSVERTLNESDQNLDTPPDPPIGSSNSNNNNNNSSFEAIPVLNFDSSFNFPLHNFPILSDFTQPEDNEEKHPSFGDFVPGTTLKDSEPPLPGNFQDQEKSHQMCYNKENSTSDNTIGVDSTNKIDKSNHIGSHDKIEISNDNNIDNRDCHNKSKCNNYNNIDKTTLYFNSYLTSLQDDKESFSETICTAETHSLISSLSQTAVVPLKTTQENRQTPLKCQQNLPSEAGSSQTSAVPQKGPKPDFITTPEPVLENEMPQLTLGCELQTSPLQINPSSSARKLPEHQDDDLDMPPRLQLEVQQPLLLLDSQCQLAPPKLIPEVTLKSQHKLRLSPSRLEQELPSLPLDMAGKEHCSLVPLPVTSPSLFSSSSSSLPMTIEPPLQNVDLLTVQEEDGFIALSKSISSFQNLHKLNLDITQCSVCSCLANTGSQDKCLGSTTASPHVNVSAPHQQWDTETNLISISTSYDSTLDRKPSRSDISLSSSSSLTSDPHVHSGNSTSESEITDSSLKLPAEGMDTSDDAYATSEWNGLKNDSSTEVKDSGFFSIDELTPKKSPCSDSRYLSSNVKKLSNIARPCSVVLEKTPETLLVHSLRFPLQKAVDQQNTFSVKRVNNNGTTSPNSRAKPRLLKRLSDNQKTFRLDYIHGNSGGRKNLSSRLSAGKTRNTMKQNYRFK